MFLDLYFCDRVILRKNNAGRGICSVKARCFNFEPPYSYESES